MQASEFLAKVEEIAAEGPSYRRGGYGRDGTCDCIGLTIGAIRRAGGAWPGTHGSNYAARYEVTGLRRLSASDLYPGLQVLKGNEPGQSGYDLPSKYMSGSDKRDYYHAGVVTSKNPLIITHSTGTGKKSSIKRDTSQGDWKYGGELKRVTYGTTVAQIAAQIAGGQITLPSANAVQSATIWSQNKGPVRIRAKPTKKCSLWWLVPHGEEVAVLETDTGSDGWWKVRYGTRTGYIWADYLSVG